MGYMGSEPVQAYDFSISFFGEIFVTVQHAF